jgi:uncharacterized protein YndB with AHSA1/START domain
MVTFLVAALLSPGLAREASPQAGQGDVVRTNPAMTELSKLIGGTWSNNNSKFLIENRYEWAFGGTAIRGTGVVGKGSPGEAQIESIVGWDPVGKSVFYIDCHGGKTVFQGIVKQESDHLLFEFATTVGKMSKWRETLKFTDPNALQFTILGEKDGNWSPVRSETLTRKTGRPDAGKQVTEGIINAPVEEVWTALCTKEGLEAWNVAHAEIDLRVGGLMRTHYDPKGRLGDPNTIENVILSFEPGRLLSIKVTNPPEKFPYKSAIKSVWHVIHFEPLGLARTRLQIIGLGYGTDEESKELRSFFDKGNAYTLKKLQEKFTPKGPRSVSHG